MTARVFLELRRVIPIIPDYGVGVNEKMIGLQGKRTNKQIITKETSQKASPGREPHPPLNASLRLRPRGAFLQGEGFTNCSFICSPWCFFLCLLDNGYSFAV